MTRSEPRTPGQLIEEVLAERGWTKRVLAIVLDMDEATITRLVAGKRSVDAATALALGESLGIEPERLLELQRSYDLAKARIEARPDPGRATRAHLFGGLPIGEMIKRGWITARDVRDVPTVERELARFFGVPTVDEIEILPHAAKKTNVASGATPTQLAWLYRVRQIASEMLVPPHSTAGTKHAIEKLRPLMVSAEAVRKVPRILAECGIRFVIVESLPSAKIDGVTLWLTDTAPVIGMTMRHDRIDNFWFVLRHELEHVLLGHGRDAIMLDVDLEGERAGAGSTVNDEERAANSAAAEFCVPRETFRRFVERKAPFFADRDIVGFANTIGVHPGLVAGQIQHQTGRYERFRAHQVKVRSMVAPSATVDGWGDVAPVGEEET